MTIEGRVMGPMGPMKLMRLMGLIALMGLWAMAASAQSGDRIVIGGNVYGGGNHAEVRGSAKVTVQKGDLQGVFGGARMANVGGHTFVNIDGEHATGDIMAVAVYGGNDISGTIGTPASVNETVPEELEDDIPTEEDREKVTPDSDKPYKNVVNDTWNCFVRMSRSTKDDGAGNTVEQWPIVIGSIYGGGNGDFTYTDENGNPLRDGDNYIAKEGDEIVAVSSTPLTVPEIDKTYLELKGGCAGHVYGGGNNATVRVNTTLNIANKSSDLLTLAQQYVAEHLDYKVEDVLGHFQSKVKLNSFQSDLGSYAYNFARIYGGNNRAEMAIRPTWNLQSGKIRDLYSGGNRGNMTSPEGLLLDIKPKVPEALQVYNVFGGCRMADVKPTVNGKYVPCRNLPGYNFPQELSARTLIHSGHITNVYGGNDITGTVYGGNAVGIYTTIYGDVYGGGNGAYAYTNQLGEDKNSIFHDFYYSTSGYASPIDALNNHRPNAEQVSIRLAGTEGQKTVIHGSVFVGGNCASLATKKADPRIELKIGSYVVADNVYLGNNGEKMADKNILSLYAGNVNMSTGEIDSDGSPYSSIGLTDATNFAKYMEGVAMKVMPSIVFDKIANDDREDYIDYSSYVGSFFCGGNVGSMAIPGKMAFSVSSGLNIFTKFVGGCNNANIAETDLNAAYEGGIIGSEDERDSYTDAAGNIKDRLEINFENMTVVPMRWKVTMNPVTKSDLKDGKLIAGREYYKTDLRTSKFIADGTEDASATTYYKLTSFGNDLEWNTAKLNDTNDDFKKAGNDDADARLLNGNIYGGCFNSGHVNGNVVININQDVTKKDQIFREFGNPTTNSAGYTKPAVKFEDQRDDLLAIAMAVFGAGYGKDTEIWGSTTINHNNGYAFQIFGGGEEGVVGKKTDILDEHGEYKESVYEYNPAYSTTVNLNATATATSNDEVVADIAEAEYLYGGGNEGDVCGNTLVNLGNGRIYDAFGGASDADILGHTEVYIGRQPNSSGGYKDGFPWIKDIVYGGNDFGGTIHGEYEDGYDFKARLRDYEAVKTRLHGYKADEIPDVLKSSTYVEFLKGRVDTIFGGGYGMYDYSDITLYGDDATMPFQESSFVNIRPSSETSNSVGIIFGGGTGYPGNRKGNQMQNRSYVLIDIPEELTNFQNTKVFGSGSYCGLGMSFTKDETFASGFNLDKASAIIDLLSGEIHSAYGGSYMEGNTRRTVVNVPKGSTTKIGSIFGGAYGLKTLPPCDVYESYVNYASSDAQCSNIYGGNNNERRTFFAHVNISAPVYSNKEKGYTGNVFGAGRGQNTWAEYTEVNLLKGAEAYNVYGGGELGHVLNAQSVEKYMKLYMDGPKKNFVATDDKWKKDENWSGEEFVGNLADWKKDWANAWSFGKTVDNVACYYDAADNEYGNYYGTDNPATTLLHPSVTERSELDTKTAALLTSTRPKRYNTNVIINEGATVAGYAYGGGLGDAAIPQSGDVNGTTYIALLGGTVKKDLYAAGTTGNVDDNWDVGEKTSENPRGFTISANAYIQGGTVRNVYGGGWEGTVGYHKDVINVVGTDGKNYATADITTTTSEDRLAQANVVIGKTGGNSLTNGVPAIARNVYGGGEGGSVFGNTHVTLFNGYVGYNYKNTAAEGATPKYEYVEELTDTKPKDLELSGNVFGGGYVVNSYVDSTQVDIFGGTVRGSVYGGGEVGPVGRGTTTAGSYGDGVFRNADAYIFKGGATQVNMYDGKVLRNVFGGGRGKDSWGGNGTMYMDENLVAALDMKCKGYVFGQTEVHIYGGEIGTEEGVVKGYGNVFGGGDEGFVYSGNGTKKGTTYSDNNLTNGLPTDGGGFYYKDDDISKGLSRSCYVEVAPHSKVLFGSLSFNPDATKGVKASYSAGEYVPVDALNQMKNWNSDSRWNQLDTRGIVIHNAIFAGGNISEGSDNLVANTTTVYGNVGASLRDVYNVDLVSIGSEDIGGLYGDGNLTLVDGFRELHIDNYGTDYYSLPETMKIDDYNQLTERQKAYYRLMYVAKAEHTFSYYESRSLHRFGDDAYRQGQKVPESVYNGFSPAEKANWRPGSKAYSEGDQIEESEYLLMYKSEQDNWTLFGVTSIYAGRPLNTIQRADMCGVFGSRMVLKGAQDRVPETVDYNNYTINRVDEVSLNKRVSIAGDTGDDAVHGNYFGIYNTVNYLGNLTSDVFFTETNEAGDAIRTTDSKVEANKASTEYPAGTTTEYLTTTYYQWKAARPKAKNRNNATSRNKVALASGVHLDIKREEGERTGNDEWGYITGVIELDLINVMPGMGGGYVYARNEHGTKTWHGGDGGWGKVTMLNENLEARTYRRFTYDEPSATGENLLQIQTSGNFVHNTKQIVDDCYPNSNMYKDGYVESPAHYWYIRGSIYVYDQYISAYTGSAHAYAEKVELPLTISAASHGKMTLRDVQPNYYAYYDKNGVKMGTEGADEQLIINNTSYRLNDPVSYWTYNLMSDGDKAKFVNKTYVVIEDCKVGGTDYAKGTVLLPTEYDALKGSGDGPAVTYDEGGVEKTDGNFDYFFRLSNNISHNTGYLLTYDVNNPMVWDNYYTKTADSSVKKNTKEYEDVTKSDYLEGPTFSPKTGLTGVYGQQMLKKGDIVYGATKTYYDGTLSANIPEADKEKQATVTERAYLVTKDHVVKDTDGSEVQHLNVGTTIYQSKYTAAQWTAITTAGAAEPAKVCTNLLDLSATDYVYAGQLLTTADITELKSKVIAKNGYTDGTKTAMQQAEAFLKDYLDDAYYCTSEGKYGGMYFEAGKAYRAIDTWCSMSDEDRQNFVFNYDALDLLVDPTYGGDYGYKPQYDGTLSTKIYSVPQAIDYMAECTQTVTYTPPTGPAVTITAGSDKSAWIDREKYEKIPNEKHHYSPITIKAPGDYYMVNKAFMRGDIPYTIGQQIDTETYNSLNEAQKTNIDVLTFTTDHTHLKSGSTTEYVETLYFYCREPYTVGEKGEGQSVTTMGVKTGASVATYNKDDTVPAGVIINKTNYDALVNKQQGFVIHGMSPTETSTLYVSNESDINDLSKEKIITVIYLYEYEESDESGMNVTPVSERHIVNIHINFQSGVPEISDVTPPDIVLPGTTLGLNIPTVTQGAYRVTESGWEMFENSSDATTHYNGQEYIHNETPVYWYQDSKYYIAYYAKTRLGKTYSNSVPVRVANYHDLKKVMDDKLHHYYIDHKDVKRNPKIYINDYSATDQNGLDLLKNLYDLSVIPSGTPSGDLEGHALLDNRVKGCANLDFFLRTDITMSEPTVPGGSPAWMPIGTEAQCFEGTLHGDGHTISGLDHSLFGNLCGDVYNLGVTGSFTEAGVANSGLGYVESCWVNTTADSGFPEDTRAVFGNPTATADAKQIVNCYYQTGKGYSTTDTDNHGLARAMTAQEFYNGTVAYNLNNFYLYKRHNDHTALSGSPAENVEYKYWKPGVTTPQIGRYTSHPDLCSSGYASKLQYVEERFADGDFRYAAGEIPASEDERHWSEEVVKEGGETTLVDHFFPIWPDDYIFFGQKLTYGWAAQAHQNLPSAVVREDGRLSDGDDANRVYRAPAYYRSGKMSVAHFNPHAYLAQQEKLTAKQIEDKVTPRIAYPNMTAIDFKGHDDLSWPAATLSASTVSAGLPGGGTAFYPPLLDDDGLLSIRNCDETQNLLAYAPSADANAKTHGVLTSYFTEPVYAEHYDNTAGYRLVSAASAATVNGHVVQSDKTAINDHLLVDKQDFNAPIAYTFDADHLMWYQRLPSDNEYVDIEQGWQGISIPFTAELVTTDTKGEITHFFSGSTKGHEYWLRHYTEISTEGDKAKATMTYPSVSDGFPVVNKTATNTFLWDYYYKNESVHNQQDKNADTYLQYRQYYNTSRSYTGYPLLSAAKPYIIGLPGKTYYEFDLSGKFDAEHTAVAIPRLSKQTITFASGKGAAIGVSDTEMKGVKKSAGSNDYTFMPTYMNMALEAGTNSYALNDDGNSYKKVPAEGKATAVSAFRPYFVATAATSRQALARSIVFGDGDGQFGSGPETALDGSLEIFAQGRTIVTRSHLKEAVAIRIVNAGGVTLKNFVLLPGETIETPVVYSGVYIVNKKKVFIE